MFSKSNIFRKRAPRHVLLPASLLSLKSKDLVTEIIYERLVTPLPNADYSKSDSFIDFDIQVVTFSTQMWPREAAIHFRIVRSDPALRRNWFYARQLRGSSRPPTSLAMNEIIAKDWTA